MAKAAEVLDFVGRYLGQGERFVQPNAGVRGSHDLASVSANPRACLLWQRGLKAAGGGYPSLWYSWVSVPAECARGLERAAGWYERQLSGYPMVPLMACGSSEDRERAGKQADARQVSVGEVPKKHGGVRLRAKNGHRVA